jgi:hypothetical protein
MEGRIRSTCPAARPFAADRGSPGACPAASARLLADDGTGAGPHGRQCPCRHEGRSAARGRRPSRISPSPRKSHLRSTATAGLQRNPPFVVRCAQRDGAGAKARGTRHDDDAVANSDRAWRWQRRPDAGVHHHVRSMGRYAAGCSGAAGDGSCELRPWRTSGSRSNPLGPTIVRSSLSTRTWRKTAGSRSGLPIGLRRSSDRSTTHLLPSSKIRLSL